MKKKAVTIMMIVLMSAMLGACGGNDTDKNKTTGSQQSKQQEVVEEPVEETAKDTKVSQISLDNDNGSLVYNRHEITTDYSGAAAIRIYFTFTNKSDTSKSVQSLFYPQVFQNGVECEFAIGNFEEQNEAADNLIKEVMKDTSLEVAFLYTLQDTQNPVLLKVSEDLLDMVYQEQELALQ